MSTPRSKVRSYPLTNDSTVAHEYNRVGLALAIFAALCFFCALWALNGYFTARTVRSIGILFHILWLSWGAGWLVHVVISLIEHHLWRLRDAVDNAPRIVLYAVYSLIIVVGTLDVLSSALAFLLFFAAFGFPLFDQTTIVTSTVLAEVIAILPEAVIVWLVVALWRVIRG